MRASIIAAAAALSLCAAQSAAAQEPQAQPEAADAEASGLVQVIRASDASLTCVQISDEAAQLSESMGGEPEGGLFNRLGGVAKAGAAMVIPGAGLVTAGVDALTQPGREREEARKQAVQNRWYYLNGLYAGQRCQARAEAVLSGTPAPVAPGLTATPTPQVQPATSAAPSAARGSVQAMATQASAASTPATPATAPR